VKRPKLGFLSLPTLDELFILVPDWIFWPLARLMGVEAAGLAWLFEELEEVLDGEDALP
jgi:hypothetical protein